MPVPGYAAIVNNETIVVVSTEAKKTLTVIRADYPDLYEMIDAMIKAETAIHELVKAYHEAAS